MGDRDQVTPLGPGVVDRGAYNYGGDPNGAANAANAMQNAANDAQGRTGTAIDTANSSADRSDGGDARGDQLSMANMLAARASGQMPSIAGMVGQQQMRQATAEQTSQAASARGPAALALAQQGAAANTANMQSTISNQTQINSANEQLQNTMAANSAYGAIRGGDQSQQGLDAQGAQAQAQIDAAQRAQNDQYTLGQQSQGISVNAMQLQADQNRDAAEQAGHFNAAGLQQQKNAAHDANVMSEVNAGIQAAGTVASAAGAMSDENAKNILPWSSDGGIAAGTNAGYGAVAQSPVDMHAMLAHQALDAQAAEDASARTNELSRGGGGGIMMAMGNAGVGALKQRDAEDLGLMQAKQRNGLDLSAREAAQQSSLQRRVGQDTMAATKALDAKAPDPAAKPAPPKDDGKGAAAVGDKIKSGLSGIGNALTARPAAGPAFQYVPAQRQAMQMPQMSTSDERTKDVADMSVVPLRREADDGLEQHYDRDVSRAKEAPESRGASLSGPSPRFSMAQAVERKPSAPAPATRKLSLEEQFAQQFGGMNEQNAARLQAGPATGAKLPVADRELEAARAMRDNMRAQQEAQLAAGPSVRSEHPMAQANRSMAAQPYAYKPEYAAAEGQTPGEKNVGPMAQNMAADPVASTAVKQDPSTGLLKLDLAKTVKLTSGGVASLQDQVDEQQQQLASMANMLRRRR